MKLTKAQAEALKALVKHPFGTVSITMWGGRPHAGMPAGIRSMATLQALARRGYATMRYAALNEHWSILPAGRAALKEMEKSDD